MSHFNHRWEMGQGLVEYALILLLVAMAVIATVVLLGTNLNDTYSDIVNMFP